MADWQLSAKDRSSPAPEHGLTCEIRALDTVAELIESYRLRYDVYGTLGYLQRCNESRLEIDGYDSLSISFGAFDPVSGVMIGTARLVTTEAQTDHEYLIRCILADRADAELTKQALGPWAHPLPSIVSHEIDRQIEAFNTERFAVTELSRIIVHPSYRGSGVLRGLMEICLAYAARRGPAILIGSCLPAHLPMYAKFGCQQLPYSGLEHVDSVGQIATMMVCRTDQLTQPTRAHVDNLVRSMASGATECTLEIGRDSRARYRIAPPRRARRHTIEV